MRPADRQVPLNAHTDDHVNARNNTDSVKTYHREATVNFYMILLTCSLDTGCRRRTPDLRPGSDTRRGNHSGEPPGWQTQCGN